MAINLFSIVLIIGGYLATALCKDKKVLDVWWFTFLPVVLGGLWAFLAFVYILVVTITA